MVPRRSRADSTRAASAIAYVAALWVPLWVFAIATKLVKASELARGLGVRPALAVTSGELLLCGTGVLVWSALLGARRAAVRRASALALHLLVPLLFSLLVAEHAFFRTSGALGDWQLLVDGVRNFPSLVRLYRSELSPGRLALLVVAWVFSLAVYGVRRAVVRRRDARPPRDAPAGRARAVRAVHLCVAAIAAGACGRLLQPPSNLAEVRPSVLGALASDAAAAAWRALRPRVAPMARASAAGGAGADADAAWLGPRALARRRLGPARNAVVVAVESLGARYVSLYGGPRGVMPFVEELAARGALVERAYTVVPHTSKALVALACGVYPKLEAGVAEAEPDGIPARCLPSLLAEQGYATGFFQTAESHYERRANLVAALGYQTFAGKESIDGAAGGFDESSYFGWEDDALVDPIARWLDGLGERPFFMTVLTLASHHPYAVPRGFPARRFGERADLDDYYNTLAYTDGFLRKLHGLLEERGLGSDTLVVVTGDHGEGFGQHGRRQHDLVPYEEGIHIPLVLAGPGVEPGRRVGGLRQITDLAPTVAGALGFAASPAFAGQDLLSAGAGHPRVFAACYLAGHCAALVEGWTKVVHHFGRRPDQLFDLLRDPAEERDLLAGAGAAGAGAAADPLLRTIAARAVDRMLATEKETNARYERRAAERLPALVSRSPPVVAVQPARARFGDFAELVGFDIEPRVVAPGGQVVVTTVYRVLRPPPAGWEAFMHLDGRGRQINADHVPAQGSYPPQRWEAGRYFVDRHPVLVRATGEPDELRVRVGFWRRATGARAPVTAEAPLVVTPDGKLDLGAVTMTGPAAERSAFVTAAPPPWPRARPLDMRLGSALRLVAVTPGPAAVKAGLKVTTTYLFEALARVPDGLELRIEVEGPAPARAEVHTPALGTAPLATWQAGEFVRDPHALTTRVTDPPGRYRVMLSLRDARRGGAPAPVTGRGLPVERDRVQVAAYEIVP